MESILIKLVIPNMISENLLLRTKAFKTFGDFGNLYDFNN